VPIHSSGARLDSGRGGGAVPCCLRRSLLGRARRSASHPRSLAPLAWIEAQAMLAGFSEPWLRRERVEHGDEGNLEHERDRQGRPAPVSGGQYLRYQAAREMEGSAAVFVIEAPFLDGRSRHGASLVGPSS
jgi:hypothetical protein